MIARHPHADGIMLTFSESVLNATILLLSVAGLFFGTRAARRRRRNRRKEE